MFWTQDYSFITQRLCMTALCGSRQFSLWIIWSSNWCHNVIVLRLIFSSSSLAYISIAYCFSLSKPLFMIASFESIFYFYLYLFSRLFPIFDSGLSCYFTGVLGNGVKVGGVSISLVVYEIINYLAPLKGLIDRCLCDNNGLYSNTTDNLLTLGCSTFVNLFAKPLFL